MADDHGAAGEVLQRFFQRPQRVDVQIVGRLVEQQDVGAFLEHASPDARGCARRRRASPTFFCWSVPAKLNRATYAREFTVVLAERGSYPGRPEISSQTRLVRVERVAVLIDVGRASTVSPTLIVPASGFSCPVIMRNSVVLPAPLGPMMPTMPPAGRSNVRFSNSTRSPKALRDAVRLDDHVARAAVPAECRFPSLRSCFCALLAQQGFIGVDAGFALGVAALGRHANPFQLALQGLLPLALGLLFLLQPRLLLLQPRRIVALPGDAHAAIEFQNPAGDVVQEVAIVRHGDHGPGILLQMLLQPAPPFGIEVVRRFVEQQNIRLLQQQAGTTPTRRFSPPESTWIGVSPGGQRSASMAISSCESRSQALR